MTRALRCERPSLEWLEDRVTMSVGVNTQFDGIVDPSAAPPDTAGAAGPNSYIQTINTKVGIFNKSGTLLTSDSISHFFFTTGGLTLTDPGSFLGDATMVYDEIIGRFVVADMDVNFSTHVGAMDFAVSKTSNPTALDTANWYFFKVAAASGFDTDYPGNFGYNADNLIYTTQEFAATNSPSHTQVTALSHASLTANSPSGFQFDLTGLSYRPVTIHDGAAGGPMWFVQEGTNNQSIKLSRFDTNLTLHNFTINVNPYNNVNPPLNPDGSQITTLVDNRILKAASAGNKIVAAHHVGVSNNEDDARWYEFDISNINSPTLMDQGNVGFGPNTYTMYPSVDINAAGSIGMGFSSSGNDSATDFMSVYVAGRSTLTPAGMMEGPVLIRAGNANNTSTRYGDFSGINVDGGTFWIADEFTASGAGEETAIAQFTVGSAAGTAFVDPHNSTLFIQGNNGIDAVVLRRNPSNSSQLEVVDNNIVIGEFNTSSFTSIKVSLFGGNDSLSFSNTTSSGLDFFNKPVTYDGGGGTNSASLNDGTATFGDTYTISGNTVSRTVFGGLTYSNVASVTLNGETGNNTYNINSNVSGTSVTINDSAGTNTFNVGNGSLNNLPGAVIVNGTGPVNINDSTAGFSDTYTLTNNTVSRTVFGGLTYSAVSSVTLNGETGGNTYNIGSDTAGIPLTFNDSAGTNTFNIGDGNLDHLSAAVVLNAGTNNTININDSTAGFSDNYTLTSNTVSRTVFGGLTYSPVASVTLNGETGNNSYNINSNLAGSPLTINDGAGTNTFNVGNGNLNSLPGAVVVNGGAGDTININDASNAGSDTYTITSNTVARPAFGGLTYNTVANVNLNAESGGNTTNVTSSNAGTTLTINPGTGTDVVNVGNASSTIDTILGNVSVVSGGGVVSLNIVDQGSSSNNAYTLNATSFTRAGVGLISFAGVNGIGLNGGTGSDTYTLTALPTASLLLNDFGGSNTMNGPNVPSVWTVSSASNMTIGSLLFANILNLVGGTDNDTFNVNGTTPATTLTLSDAAGTNSFNVGNGDLDNLPGAVVVNGAVGGIINMNDNGVSFGDPYTITNNTVTRVIFGGLTYSGVPIVLNGETGNNAYTINTTSAASPLTINDTAGINTYNVGTGNLDSLPGAVIVNGGGNDAITLNDNTATFNDIYTITGTTVGRVVFGGLTYNNPVASVTLNGETGNNSYNVTVLPSSPFILNDAGGTDSMTGPNVASLWSILGTNSFSIGTLTANSIESIVGGTGDDTFSFVAAGQLSGSIDGGGGFNTLDYSSLTTPVSVNLATSTATGITGTFTNIQNAVGGMNSSNQFQGPNSNSNYFLSGTNNGFVGSFNFSGFPNLVGGTGNDDFVFFDGTLITGNINGGGGASNGIEEYATTTPTTATPSAGTISHLGGTFSNLQWLTASVSAGGTLNGASTANTFNITAADTVNLGGMTFNLFNNMIGGAANDLFKFSLAGSLTGSIDGGAGVNTLDQSTFTTPIAADFSAGTITGVGTTFANIGALLGGTALNTLKGPAAGSTFNITGTNIGSITGVTTFNKFGTLIGGVGNDTFKFGASGLLSGSVDGGAGSNTLDYSVFTTQVVVNLAASTASRITSGFTNIQGVVGGTNTTNTLTGPAAATTFTITGTNAGNTSGGFSFSAIRNIVGGAGNDTIAFGSAGTLSGTINGGGGTNTIDESAKTSVILGKPSAGTISNVGATYSNFLVLIGSSTAFGVLTGASTATTFIVNGVNSGTVGTTTFSSFKSLIGDVGNDIFKFLVGGSITGGIDGGLGVNTIDQTAVATPISANLTTKNLTGLGTTFNNIQTLIGGTAANTLTGPAAGSTFNITGTNLGNVAGVAFNKYATLIGGAGNDTFKFVSASVLTGTAKGGGGTTNTLDYSGMTTQVNINIATSLASRLTTAYAAIQNVIGSSFAGNQLTGPTTSTTYNITGANTGNVAGLTFSAFARLIAANGNDIFKFSNGATLSSSIEGGNGTNTLDLSLYTTPVVANFGASTITGIGGTYTNIRSITGGTAANTLTGPVAASSYSITGTNTGIVGPLTFAKFGTINGNVNNDTFLFGTTAVITNTINGGGGTNTFNYAAIATQVNVNLGTSAASRVTNPFSNIQNFIGGGFAGNQLTGPAAGATFNVTGASTGNLAGATFSSFGKLIGGAGDDTFVMSNGATLTSGIDGGTGSNWLDYGAYTTNVSVNLTTGAATGLAAAVSNIGKVRGGSGNDTLTGNSAGNVLIGGAGNDTLNGGSGRSILIGGTGLDTVTGGSNDDIVIGGSTTFDSNFAALDSILNEWKSTTDSYTTRVSLIKNGGGLNGTNKLILGTTVIDDLAVNVLTGGAGTDWFFKGANSTISDLAAGEQVN